MSFERHRFDHIGIPTTETHEGEVFVEATRVWLTSPRSHPANIEWLRYEPDTPVPAPVRDLAPNKPTGVGIETVTAASVKLNWTDALSGKVAGLNLVRSNSGPAGSNKIILTYYMRKDWWLRIFAFLLSFC